MLRKILLALAVLVCLAVVFWIYTNQRKIQTVLPNQLKLAGDITLPQQLPKGFLPDNPEKSLSDLSSRAQSAVQNAGAILGTAVQQSSESGGIQEKAFNYARYLYCQQVVNEY